MNGTRIQVLLHRRHIVGREIIYSNNNLGSGKEQWRTEKALSISPGVHEALPIDLCQYELNRMADDSGIRSVY